MISSVGADVLDSRDHKGLKQVLDPDSDRGKPQVRMVFGCTGMGGAPQKVPYIVVWRDLVEGPTSWIKLFLPSGLPSHSLEPETANQLIALPFVLAAQEREGAGKEQQVDWSSQTP